MEAASLRLSAKGKTATEIRLSVHPGLEMRRAVQYIVAVVGEREAFHG